MTLNEKLNEIQIKLKAPKGQYNSFGKYNYRSCEDILEGLKPLLEATKTTVRLQDEIVMIGSRIYVKATATISDGEASISTTAFAREAESKKGMDESQVTGTASSYARKYALNGLLAIDDTKDADCEQSTPTPQTRTAPQRNAPPAQKQAPSLGFTPKGGETTPAEKAEIGNLVHSKFADGKDVFTRDEVKKFSDMRRDFTAQEVIAKIKAELQKRLQPLPPEVEAVKETFDGEVVQPGFEGMENVQTDGNGFEIF